MQINLSSKKFLFFVFTLAIIGTLLFQKNRELLLPEGKLPSLVVNVGTTTYTNNEFGYAIDFPTEFDGVAGCRWDGDSYRTENGPVPMTIFENGKTSYIDHEYSYKLSGETVSPPGYHTYSECLKVMNSLEKINQSAVPSITVNVLDERPLADQVKELFGPDCKIGNRTSTSDGSGYVVEVLGGAYYSSYPENLENNPEDCSFPQQNRTLLYYPNHQLLVDYVFGSPQFCYFYSEKEGTCLDKKVANTFRITQID